MITFKKHVSSALIVVLLPSLVFGQTVAPQKDAGRDWQPGRLVLGLGGFGGSVLQLLLDVRRLPQVRRALLERNMARELRTREEVTTRIEQIDTRVRKMETELKEVREIYTGRTTPDPEIPGAPTNPQQPVPLPPIPQEPPVVVQAPGVPPGEVPPLPPLPPLPAEQSPPHPPAEAATADTVAAGAEKTAAAATPAATTSTTTVVIPQPNREASKLAQMLEDIRNRRLARAHAQGDADAAKILDDLRRRQVNDAVQGVKDYNKVAKKVQVEISELQAEGRLLKSLEESGTLIVESARDREVILAMAKARLNVARSQGLEGLIRTWASAQKMNVATTEGAEADELLKKSGYTVEVKDASEEAVETTLKTVPDDVKKRALAKLKALAPEDKDLIPLTLKEVEELATTKKTTWIRFRTATKTAGEYALRAGGVVLEVIALSQSALLLAKWKADVFSPELYAGGATTMNPIQPSSRDPQDRTQSYINN